MYSSGLPVLYPVAFIFYTILYWVYKTLLLKYYQRTSRFNEQLAIESVAYIKYGVLFHMLLGAFMYTNSRLLSSSQEAYIKDVALYLKALGSKFIRERFDSAHSQLYFVVISLFFVLFVF
jgi:uncharacterized protein YacL